jgi:hypothetical protein
MENYGAQDMERYQLQIELSKPLTTQDWQGISPTLAGQLSEAMGGSAALDELAVQLSFFFSSQSIASAHRKWTRQMMRATRSVTGLLALSSTLPSLGGQPLDRLCYLKALPLPYNLRPESR